MSSRASPFGPGSSIESAGRTFTFEEAGLDQPYGFVATDGRRVTAMVHPITDVVGPVEANITITATGQLSQAESKTQPHRFATTIQVDIADPALALGLNPGRYVHGLEAVSAAAAEAVETLIGVSLVEEVDESQPILPLEGLAFEAGGKVFAQGEATETLDRVVFTDQGDAGVVDTVILPDTEQPIVIIEANAAIAEGLEHPYPHTTQATLLLLDQDQPEVLNPARYRSAVGAVSQLAARTALQYSQVGYESPDIPDA